MIVFLVLLALIAPIVVVDLLQDEIVLPKLVTTAAFTGGALVWAAVQLARGRRPGGRWPAAIIAAAAVFAAINVLALLLADDWRWSLVGVRQRYQGLATTLIYVLLFAVSASAVRTTRDLRWLALALFTGALGAAIYALIQRAGLDWVDWRSVAPGRPASTVGQTNSLAAYLLAVISASGVLLLRVKARWQQAGLAAAVLAMAAALIFTLSRAAYVATFVVLIVWSVAAALWFVVYRFGRRPGRAEIAVAGGSAAFVAAAVVVLGAAAFVTTGSAAVGREADQLESESVGGRLSLWRLALRMTADEPLLGHGQDAYTNLFAGYRDEPDLAGIGTANVAPESAHNLLLDLSVGTGVLGLLSFLALTGVVLWYGARRAFETDDGELRLAVVALGAGAVGYLVAIFFGFSEGMTTWVFWLLLGALAGLMVRATGDAADATGSSALPEPAGRLLGSCALALLGAAVLAWAALLTAADLAAGQADEAVARGDPAAAVRLASRAADLNPWFKPYLVTKAERTRDAAGLSGDEEAGLEDAIREYEGLLRRFEPAAFDVLGLALTKVQLAQDRGEPLDDELDLLDQAVELDPYNFTLRSFVADYFDDLGYAQRAEHHRLVILGWQSE